MGKALIPDRYIDIFQGRAPRSILAKHYTPQGIRLLREIYDKAALKILAFETWKKAPSGSENPSVISLLEVFAWLSVKQFLLSFGSIYFLVLGHAFMYSLD